MYVFCTVGRRGKDGRMWRPEHHMIEVPDGAGTGEMVRALEEQRIARERSLEGLDIEFVSLEGFAPPPLERRAAVTGKARRLESQIAAAMRELGVVHYAAGTLSQAMREHYTYAFDGVRLRFKTLEVHRQHIWDTLERCGCRPKRLEGHFETVPRGWLEVTAILDGTPDEVATRRARKEELHPKIARPRKETRRQQQERARERQIAQARGLYALVANAMSGPVRRR